MADPKKPGLEMPFLDHLEELRHRLFWALGALVAGFVIAFVLLVNVDVIAVLQRPIAPFLEGRKLVFTHPGDPFRIVMTAAFAIGLILALPVMLYQLWRFVSPALYQHEKRIAIPVMLGASALFATGVGISYFLILPITLRFLLGFQAGSLEPMITAGDYFGFAITMALAFGVVFELPILVLALTALGIVTPAMLHRLRRHAIVGCLVLAAFITPGGDPVSLMAMSLPLYVLYEFSVWLSAIVYRRQERRRALEDAGQVGATA